MSNTAIIGWERTARARSDFDAAKRALEAAGFVHQQAFGVEMFLDGPDGRAKEAVHILFACEPVHPGSAIPCPNVSDSEPASQFPVVSLPALVGMKLNSFRIKDRMHLLDLIDVGLVDSTWTDRFPGELGKRLQRLIDDPDQA